MKTYTLAILLFGCGAPIVPTTCPSTPSPEAPCCESELAEQRCIGGQRWACETQMPCYASESVDGTCPNAPDGGPLHPELVGRFVWYQNGACAP